MFWREENWIIYNNWNILFRLSPCLQKCRCERAAVWPEAFAPWCPFCGIRVAVFIQPVTACSVSPAQMFLALNQTRLASLFIQSHVWEWLEELKITTEGDAAGTAGDREIYSKQLPPEEDFVCPFAPEFLLNRLANKVWLSDTRLCSFY